MATERGRGRRMFHFSRGGAGNRHHVHNDALYRYTREEVMSMYTDAAPDAATTDFESEVYLPVAQPCFLRAGEPFSSPLGDDIVAERHPKAPEWANPHPPKSDPPPPDVAVVQSEEIYEEKYAEIDRQMELKLKVEEEKEEPIPEWMGNKQEQDKAPPVEAPKPLPPLRPAAKFSAALLRVQLAKGDPFAQIIAKDSSEDTQGFTYVFQQSSPLEKMWFYRDPQNQVQGPFSSAEMYNWNLVGYFPDSLLVALQTPESFVPLKDLCRGEEKKGESPQKEEPQEEFSLFSYNSDKSTKKEAAPAAPVSPPKKQTVWGPKEPPVTKSLLEIQREEIATGNRKS